MEHKRIESNKNDDIFMVALTLLCRMVVRAAMTWRFVVVLTENFGNPLGVIGGYLSAWTVYHLVMAAAKGICRDVFGKNGPRDDIDLLVELVEKGWNE